MIDVLHVLPHRGGGAESYLDLLDRLPDVRQRRVALADAVAAREGGPSILRNWPRVARAAGGADVVHAHGDVASVLALPILRRRPSVWTPQGLHALRRLQGAKLRAFRVGLRAVVTGTGATLCSSEAERDDLLAVVGTAHAHRLRVIPNGAEVPPETTAAARAAARRALGMPQDGPVALFLAVLDDRKDPLTAARAAIAAQMPLLVAGEGPRRADLEALGSPLVRVLGYRDDVDRLLTAADVFVLPSSREGMSLSLMEAMGRGLALVVADGLGNPETVGDAGVVLPFGDVPAWTTALVDLRDDDRRAALGAAARRRALDHFDPDRFAAAVDAAYHDALR